MKILITGGNGFLGRHLIASLQERGDTVSILALPSEDTTWLEERNVTVFRGNILDPENSCGPDARHRQRISPRSHDRHVALNA